MDYFHLLNTCGESPDYWIEEIVDYNSISDITASSVIVPEEYFLVNYFPPRYSSNAFYDYYYNYYVPSMYLKSNTQIIGGTGTKDDPFIIN